MLEVIIGVSIAILGSWGTIWYKLGKLTNEVKHHNRTLEVIGKKIDKLLKEP